MCCALEKLAQKSRKDFGSPANHKLSTCCGSLGKRDDYVHFKL